MKDTNLAYHTPHWSGGCGIGNLVCTMARFFNISKHIEINQRTCSAHLNLSDMLRKLSSRRNDMTVQKQETPEIYHKTPPAEAIFSFREHRKTWARLYEGTYSSLTRTQFSSIAAVACSSCPPVALSNRSEVYRDLRSSEHSTVNQSSKERFRVDWNPQRVICEKHTV